MSAATLSEREDKHLDTTPQDIYNPTTTLFITPAYVKDHLGGYQPVAKDFKDISRLHRHTLVQQHRYLLQHLGNTGTAAKAILYTLPQRTGATSGFCVHDWYFRNPHHLRYYNTKSPYAKLNITLSQLTYLTTDVCFSRNVTPHWDIGACFKYLDINRRWVPFDTNDRDALSQGVDFFTHFKTPAERYQLFLHLLLGKHQEFQAGGIIGVVRSQDGKLGYGQYIPERRETPLGKGLLHETRQLNRLGHPPAESTEVRKQLYGYHQLAMLAELLWGYHELSIGKQEWRLEKLGLREGVRETLGGSKEDPEMGIKDTAFMWDTENEWGLKGNWSRVFGRGYYRHRYIRYRQEHLYKLSEYEDFRCKENKHVDLHEHYVGLSARCVVIAPNHKLHAQGEYLLGSCYKAKAGYQGPHFALDCQHIKYTPSLIARYYESYHRAWQHKFELPTATCIAGSVEIETRAVKFRPRVQMTRIRQPIYFKHAATPKGKAAKADKGSILWAKRLQIIALPCQAQGHADVFSAGAACNLSVGKHVHWDTDVVYAQVSGKAAAVFQVPTLFLNTKLYYEQKATAGDGIMAVGVDMHYKSTYMADGYDLVTRQFYLQDEFAVRGYPVLNLFCNFRIKSFCGFLKVSHINQHLPWPGYFITPYYPGAGRSFDLGIHWALFN